MDISKLSANEKLSVCKKYFYIGLCCLPLVWLTNIVWFFSEAFCNPPTPERKEIKRYLWLSGMGVTCWTFAIVAWELYFQSYRSLGLPWSDFLTFVYPKGRV
ncbi:unnamed protein product [Auanema sp. JU1783]|nr:unnamed protein product [Auanema sp. JU1783]